MIRQIQNYKADPEKVRRVEEGLGLPFAWVPGSTTLADALEQSRQFWQDPQDGAMPGGFVEALNRSLSELAHAGLIESSLQVGHALPSFSLSNQLGETIESAALLKRGPLVVTFYRGGWCPYCNLALRALEKVLPEIQAAGGNLVAITPERPDDSLTIAEKNCLKFDLLFDDGLLYAKQLGIVWKIPDYALQWHEKYFGLHLEEHNGHGHRDELPVPATFVVDTDGVVRWRFVEAQYWKRAEPQEVLQAVKGLSAR